MSEEFDPADNPMTNAPMEADPSATIAETTTAPSAGATQTTARPARRQKAGPKRRTAGGPRHKRHVEPPHVVHHYQSVANEGDGDGFFARHRAKIIVGVLLLLIGVAAHFVKPGSGPVAKAPERIVTIQLPPPPPPPPPPKREPPPPKEDKQIAAEAPVDKPVDKPKPVEAPKAELGTGLKGAGPGLAGLGSGPGEGGGFGGPGSGNGASQLAIFAGQVKSKVTEALRSNSRTRKAALNLQVRIWPDSTGRVTRAKLDATTGDKALDDVIQNQVLTNLQLPGPPPPGAHLPIVMRLSATRP